MKKRRFLASLLVTALLVLGLTLPAAAQVEPPTVEREMRPGDSITVEKEVTTPAIPPVVDICLLEDETGSFADDIDHLQGGTTASDIYETIVATSPNAQFAVAGFRDYPVWPHGGASDWVYNLLSPMSPAKANWLAGIAALTAGGGADGSEAQYDAIVAATGPGVFNDPTLGPQPDCGWRDPTTTPGVQRVLVVTTDAPFHLPGAGKPHVNNQASTIAALNAQNIIVIGLKAPGSGGELDALAAATGGSTQPLSSDGTNIAQAILDGLEELTTDVWWEVTHCDPGLTVTFDRDVEYGIPGNTAVTFEETITIDSNEPPCKKYTATVTFYANSYEEGEGAIIGEQTITVGDITPPKVWIEESVNPSGKKIPPAGSSTLPGPKGGINDDGFYKLLAEDNCDPYPVIVICWEETPGKWVWLQGFWCLSGTTVKITQAPGAAPSFKNMGSTKGKAGAVAWHVIIPTDALVIAVDSAGNWSYIAGSWAIGWVPPAPK